MYYISGVVEESAYVVDASDGVVDKMTFKEVLVAKELGFDVLGVYDTCFCQYTYELAKLIQSELGTPVRVKVAKGIEFKQTLYIGHEFDGSKDIFYFYDDSGVDGYFGVSNDFVLSNRDSVQFDFENTESARVSVLVRRFKDSGGR